MQSLPPADAQARSSSERSEGIHSADPPDQAEDVEKVVEIFCAVVNYCTFEKRMLLLYTVRGYISCPADFYKTESRKHRGP